MQDAEEIHEGDIVSTMLPMGLSTMFEGDSGQAQLEHVYT